MYFNATANCAYRETAELIAGHSARDEGGREVGKGDGTGKTGGGKEGGGTRRPRFSGARAHGYRYFGVR